MAVLAELESLAAAWLAGQYGFPVILLGLLIGLAAAAYLLGNGRIMGVSGILAGLVDGSGRNRFERISFLVGLIGAPAVVASFMGAIPTHATSSAARRTATTVSTAWSRS